MAKPPARKLAQALPFLRQTFSWARRLTKSLPEKTNSRQSRHARKYAPQRITNIRQYYPQTRPFPITTPKRRSGSCFRTAKTTIRRSRSGTAVIPCRIVARPPSKVQTARYPASRRWSSRSRRLVCIVSRKRPSRTGCRSCYRRKTSRGGYFHACHYGPPTAFSRPSSRPSPSSSLWTGARSLP